jgi:hypothetical protein
MYIGECTEQSGLVEEIQRILPPLRYPRFLYVYIKKIIYKSTACGRDGSASFLHSGQKERERVRASESSVSAKNKTKNRGEKKGKQTEPV